MGHLGVDRSALERFLARVAERFPLERAILFGSRARGTELVDSDYDLVLVSRAFEGLTWQERVTAVLELWELDVDLQPLCYTPEELARKSQEICTTAEAVREGIEVYRPYSHR